MAAKTGIQSLLKGTAARSAAVGAPIVGVHDVGMQTGVEMQLDEDQKFDPTRAAIATGIGAIGGAVAPAAIKGIGKVLSGTGKVIKGTGKAIAHPIQTAQKGYGGLVKATGGGEAAREGVAREVQENLTKNLGDAGKEEAAESLGQSLKAVIRSGKQMFTERYDKLGDIEVSKSEVQALVDTLHSKSGVNRIANLEDTIQLMKSGDLTPTQALRQVRSSLGSEANKARRGVGTNVSADRVLSNFYSQSRALFNKAASRAGKGKEASLLDKDYGKFVGIKNNRTIVNAQEDFSASTRKLNQAISSKDPHKVDEFLDEMYELGRLSGDQNFGDLQKQNLQKALHEHLFTGQSASTLKRFLGDKSGVKVLQKVFGDIQDKAQWKTYANILESAHDSNGAGLFVTRLAAGAGGFAGGGIFGTVGALAVFQGIIKSKGFQTAAMKVFSGNPKAKEKGLGMIAKMMESKGMDAVTRTKIMDMLIGATAIGAAGYKAKDVDTDKLQVRASQGLKQLDPSISHYFD